MYSVCVGKVKGAGVESDCFNIESAVRQGDVLSLLVFDIFMDRCLRDAQLNDEVETLMYTDDVAVITKSSVETQEVVHRWTESATRNGMKINTGETKPK